MPNEITLPKEISHAKLRAWARANDAMRTALWQTWDIVSEGKYASEIDIDNCFMEDCDYDKYNASLSHAVSVFSQTFTAALKEEMHKELLPPNTLIKDVDDGPIDGTVGTWASWIKLLKPLGDCVFLDIETTGLSLDSDRIVQIGLVEFKRDRGVVPFVTQFLINPNMPISPGAMSVHGIKPHDVKDCCSFEHKIGQIREILRDSVVVGYNIHKFDLPIIDRQVKEANAPPIQFDYSIDLFQMVKQFRSNKLEQIQEEYCKIPRTKHSAVDDCLRCIDIIEPLLSRFTSKTEFWPREDLLKPETKSFCQRRPVSYYAHNEPSRKRMRV